MIKKTFISFIVLLLAYSYGIAQNVNIPDNNFRNALIDFGVDLNNDGFIQTSEAVAITKLDVSNSEISNLTGIETFINLDTLNCSSNQLVALNLSQNTKLRLLYCSINKLTSLDLSSNTSLISLSCSNNKLTGLNVSQCPLLEFLDCGFNQLSALNVSANPNLKILECYVNQLNSIDVSLNPALESFYCHNNKLKKMDLSANINLKLIDCQFNQLDSINVTGCTELTNLACYSNQLRNLILTTNTKLKSIDCGANLYSFLNLSKIEDLNSLDCAGSPNLAYICVKDITLVVSNFNFYKDDSAQWTEDCTLTTGVISSSSESFFKLHPNQSKEDFKWTSLKPASIFIFNSLGQEIERYAAVQELRFGQTYVPGLYFVHILQSAETPGVMIKIIKE